MATTRPFAYNPQVPTPNLIPGTLQIGDLAIGIDALDYSSSPGGVSWWMGPDEDAGYVITAPVAGSTQPTMLINPSGLLTLSDLYRGADITLTDGGTTAYQQFGYQMSVLGNTIIGEKAKVMFSVGLTLADPGTSADSHFVGVGRINMNYQGNPYGGYPGNDGNSLGYCSDGTIRYNGNVYDSGYETFGDGDVIDIAINYDISGLWVRVNGGFWNNNDACDPATDTGAMEIISGTPLYPVICPGYEGTMYVLNSTSDLPAGYDLLGSNVTASIEFYRSTDLTDGAFISLVNQVFGQTFTTVPEAGNFLTSNGYWHSHNVSFTLSSADFGNGYPIYQNTAALGTNGVDGFENTAAESDFFAGYYGESLSVNAINNIEAAMIASGIDPANSQGYVWSVNWGAGSSVSTGYVKFEYSTGNSTFQMQAIDPADTDWTIPGVYNGTTLVGTFLFPATFSAYIPLVDKGGWC